MERNITLATLSHTFIHQTRYDIMTQYVQNGNILTIIRNNMLKDSVNSETEETSKTSAISTVWAQSIESQLSTMNTTISGKAPTDHSSTATTYGVGNTSKYGHVKVDTAINQNGANPVTGGAIYTALAGKQDTLESGVNIKTINSASVLGSGNLNVVTDVSNKQDTLVSGTNIKTINNSSILGSGNINLQTPLVAGTDYATPTASAITLSVKSTANTDMLKTYVISQGGSTIGEIDIPKDLVVTSGSEIVELDAGDVTGLDAGTYLKLVIANSSTPIYINVNDLCEVYTAAQSATKIQLSIDSSNVISASIVTGSIEKTDLVSGVQTSLGLADTAVQPADISSFITRSDVATSNAFGTVKAGTNITNTDGVLSVDFSTLATKSSLVGAVKNVRILSADEIISGTQYYAGDIILEKYTSADFT